MRRLIGILSMATTLVVLTTVSAMAAGDFVIPIDNVVRAPEGSVTELILVDTPPELIGSTCVGLATVQNQESVHPDNDIIIETGDSQTVLEDVEGSPGKTTGTIGDITLGATVKLSLLMGPDEVFSGGLVVIIDVNCTPPTTVPTTVTTPPAPAIVIEKLATPVNYVGDVGEFTITVQNPGPVALHDVRVTDQYALDIDEGSDCPRSIGDLAVDEEFTYECTISGLDGVSIYDNVAIAIGIGPNETEVTATDNAMIHPIAGVTLTTQAPPTTESPVETLPVTGISGDQARGFGVTGFILVMSGIVILSGAALIGQRRTEN